MDEEFQQTLGRWPAGARGDWQRWVLLREATAKEGRKVNRPIEPWGDVGLGNTAQITLAACLLT